MTIRRQWLLILTLTAVLAVFINSAILDSLINKYFLTYNSEAYDYHVDQIEQLAASALLDNSLTERQLSVQFESHLDDPIVSIKLYNADGQLVASAENTGSSGSGMMSGMMNGMMSRMMREHSEEVDSFDVTDGSAVIGVLHITRYSALNQSAASTMFQYALLRNSLLSFVIVLCALIAIGIFVSRRLSRDLTNTASQALSIDMGDRPDFKLSKVKEIKIIQTSLEELQNRLKIKQVGRKRVVDEFVHQTRTPLTILKTHLEGIEDGIISMSGDEMKVCQSQIDNLSAIISNMSMLLDADRPTEAVRMEEFDLHTLLMQIINGMKVPFEKRKSACGCSPRREPSLLPINTSSVRACIIFSPTPTNLRSPMALFPFSMSGRMLGSPYTSEIPGSESPKKTFRICSMPITGGKRRQDTRRRSGAVCCKRKHRAGGRDRRCPLQSGGGQRIYHHGPDRKLRLCVGIRVRKTIARPALLRLQNRRRPTIILVIYIGKIPARKIRSYS